MQNWLKGNRPAWMRHRYLAKMLLVMKITIILLTVAALHVSAKVTSQTVSFTGKDVPLEDVFAVIKKQTGYVFFFDNNVLEETKPVTLNVKSVPVEAFLDQVLTGQSLSYSIKKKTIFIKKTPLTVGLNPRDHALSPPIIGIVRGPDGQPLSGVNIMVKGTKRGTITDSDGRFKIAADEGSILEISAIGFGKKEIKITNQRQIIVALEITSSVLDEVQYIAYGQTSRRYSVSNVGSVKAADIEKQPVQNVLLTLQARVPGLFITQPSGISGSGVKVRIQGQNSIRNGSDPLYVIDGVPIDAQMPSTGFDYVLNNSGANFIAGGNPLNYLNPLDIESVEVLKDADATAIYGSRAANGAILITTKKGKAGIMKLDVNMQTGWGKMTRRLDMLNTRQYLDMRYEAFANDNIDWRDASVSANDLKVWDTTSYTNWQDELLGGTSHYNDINASVSGGSSNIRYLVSGSFHKETTVFRFPEFADNKAAMHFNLDANNNNQKLKMQFSGNFMFDNNRLPQFDITQSAMLKEPNAPPLLNADGSINWAPDGNGNSTAGGPASNVMIHRLRKYENNTYNLVNSFKIDYNILPGFTIGSSVGFNYMQTNDYYPEPLVAVAPERRTTSQRGANFGDRNIITWIIEPQANYRTKVENGTLNIIIGSTFQQRTAVSRPLTGIGQLSDDLLDNISSAATIIKQQGSSSDYRYNAVFARVSYSWSDKYIVNVNGRRDGSTRFGENNRFHNFGSIGTAWIFSSETFLKRYTSIISFGKLRGSYGTTGSDQIGDYQFMSLYNLSSASLPYQGIVGLLPAGLPNPSLQWEETKKLQVGIDLGFVQDRLMVNATFARNRCSNQLLRYPLPNQAGITNYLVNFPATIQNKSWELSITGRIIQKNDGAWTSSINVTLPQNKLIEFPGLASSTYSETMHLGEPIDVDPWYHWLGVAPGTGDYLFEDKKGNPTLSPTAEDRTVLISQFPKWYGGFENTIVYKGLQLSFIFQFVKQIGDNSVEFFNGYFRYPGMFATGVSNQPTTVLNRWQKSGDIDKSVARFRTTEVQDILESDRAFADASYIRLKNVSLSWNLPRKWADKTHCRNFRMFLHGQNVLTFTNYKGLDPESQSMLSLPPLKVWTIGVQLGL